jgi:hypothetical protein
MLKHLVKLYTQNPINRKMTPVSIATVFGSMCLRRAKDPPGKTTSRKQLQQMTKKKAAFFYNFLINEYDD